MRHFHLFVLGLLLCSVTAFPQAFTRVHLPAPDTTGGKPLMQVLKERKSARSFSQEKLPLQVLSNLLWAGFGINRTDGRRTAPSARNWQDIDIYVAMEDGLYLYDAHQQSLEPIVAGDLRSKTGQQEFVKEAPVNLIYVEDLAKAQRASGDEQALYSGANTGFIAENVYLYCASEGLAVVVRAMIDRPALAAAMKLRADQKIILSQTVGYPKK
jgi:SagB-type dehydrogenase family enzyme